MSSGPAADGQSSLTDSRGDSGESRGVVALALRRPYTFIVMAMLIVLATPFVLRNMAMDIFPEINIPVISIIWNYTGLPAQEMGQRIAGSSPASAASTFGKRLP